METTNPCGCPQTNNDTYIPVPSPCTTGCISPTYTDCVFTSSDITICTVLYPKGSKLTTVLMALADRTTCP